MNIKDVYEFIGKLLDDGVSEYTEVCCVDDTSEILDIGKIEYETLDIPTVFLTLK